MSEKPNYRNVKDFMRKGDEIWCASQGTICGYYNLRKNFMSAVLQYMEEEGLTKEDVYGISGIGCSGRFTEYQDFVTIHTTHGNAANTAQGLERNLKSKGKKGLVYMVSGDGDGMAIGRFNLENLCHANSDVSYIICNNSIYAMTGGQSSPLTKLGVKTISAPLGTFDEPLDTVRVSLNFGATFVARIGTYNHESKKLQEILYKSFKHRGTSIIEVISPCQTKNPLCYGKKITELQQDYLNNSIDIDKIKPYNGEEAFEITADVRMDKEGNLYIPKEHFEAVQRISEINPKQRYSLLDDYLIAKGMSMTITGIIFQRDKDTFSNKMLKQRVEVKGSIPKSRADRVRGLLDKFKAV